MLKGGHKVSSILLKGAQFIILAADVNDTMEDRIFGLDIQLIVDTVILACAVFVLFTLLSYLLFNPARKLLRARQDRIREELEFSAKEKADAIEFKNEYNAKLKAVDKEVDVILSDARKKALKRENEIVEEAKVEAGRIITRAAKEAELEKNKVKDEVKKEMIEVAAFMAGKIIEENIDEIKQTQLIENALSEMGDETWQS